ncbi:MAG: S8 family peptidase [Acidobacteria bacterium]|nr:S8 family peptidase [Acidobacteriota bacterium]
MRFLSTRFAALVVVAASALATAAAPASAQHARKIDRAVRSAMAKGVRTQRVIVTVQPGYRAALRQALRQHGDAVKSEHALIDGVSADLHSVDVDELARLPWVKEIAADALVHADARKVASRTQKIAGRSKTAARGSVSRRASTILSSTLRETLGLAPVALAGTPTGAGIGVAVIDSGIAPSRDFNGRISGFWDFTRGGIATSPFDDYGHGTHVAGLIGSSGRLSNFEFQGVAPAVRLYGLKVLDSTGAGYTSDVINALEFVIANRAALGVHIVNLSLGHPIYAPAEDDPLVQAVERASASGLIVVVSAGNFGQAERSGEVGYLGITSPGNARSAITVGAADTKHTTAREDDEVARYSSRGPTWFDALAKPDLVAPGHRLASDTNATSYLFKLLKSGHVKSRNGGDYLELSGASMATAVASGVAALALDAHNRAGLQSVHPISANLMKGILEYSAIPLSGFDALSQGAGGINAAGAIELAGAIDTDVAPGLPWFSIGITPSSMIGGQSHQWSQQVIWGGTILGGDVLYVSSAAWGAGAVWGASDEGDNIVWGTGVIVSATDIVWGANAVWGANVVWGSRLVGAMSDDGDNIVWGTSDEGDNIVWGTLTAGNIVWGMRQGDAILFATADEGDNIVWGTADEGDNIVWGTADEGDNIIWGTSDEGDNIVWGTSDDGDNIVWGMAAGVF